jgi:hypothetical protein
MRIKHTFRLPPALSSQLADYAGRKGISQALVVEAALASFLSPDASERLEHHMKISNEAIALFVRFWLTTTPALPDAARAAAQASGNERYRGFIEALGRRIEKGQNLSAEIAQDIEAGPGE